MRHGLFMFQRFYLGERFVIMEQGFDGSLLQIGILAHMLVFFGRGLRAAIYALNP